MLVFLTMTLFLLVATGTAWMALHAGGWRTRAVRLFERSAPAAVRMRLRLPWPGGTWSAGSARRCRPRPTPFRCSSAA